MARRLFNSPDVLGAMSKSPSRVWLRQKFGSPHSKQANDKG
jgi:hypothetical protein